MKREILQKELLPGWSVMYLGDLLERVTNGLTCDQEKEPPGIPVTRIETISNGVVNFERVRYVRDIDDAKKNRFLLQRGDILFSHINSDPHLGKTAVVTSDKPLLHGMNLLLLRTKRELLDPYYLHYLLNYYRHIGTFMAIAQHAVNQSSLNQKKINSLEIPLAPLDLQKRIVAEIEKQFSRLDESIANLKRVKANLKRYKASVLKAAVEGRLVETEAELARSEGRSYETGEQLLQRILETRRSQWKGKGKYKEPAAPDTVDLPELPEGWVWAAVTQVADVASGNTPTGILDAVKQTGDVPWFKVGDMNHEENQQVMRRADAWLSLAEMTELGLRLFSQNTVLFPKRGGAIVTNKKRRLESAGCADLNVMGITPDGEIALYFFAWFDSVDLAGLSDGSNVPQINHKDIEPLVIPLPSLGEQRRIVTEVDRRISLVREIETQVDANLQRADRLRQSILKRAFSGQLAANSEPDTEVATLLKGIGT